MYLKNSAVGTLSSLINHRKVSLVCNSDAIKWVSHVMLSVNWGLGSFNDLVILGTAYVLGSLYLHLMRSLRSGPEDLMLVLLRLSVVLKEVMMHH